MRAIAFITTIFLTACQSAYLPDGRPNENSTLLEVSAGSRLVINRKLTIQPYQHAIFLQNGKVYEFSGINKYDTYCAISVDGRHDAIKSIEQGIYVVKRTYKELVFQVARATAGFITVMRDNDTSNDWHVMATMMDISSTQNSQRLKVTCASWGLPQDTHNLTVKGIRRSFGEVISLDISGSETNTPR